MSEILRIRPYARLITMLGDQLIKNERIALVELIKNAYDADAEWVKVSFVNFNNDFTVNANSKIIIEDNGNGMNREIIEKHWLNPATPEKIKRKRVKSVTDKGRIIQGEKGIGRFAIFKLGKRVTICTRRRLQDTGKNGLFYLLNLVPIAGQIVLIVFYCQDSEPGNNQYGANPKYVNKHIY